MNKEDLKKLSKEQLESILIDTYQHMDFLAVSNEKETKKFVPYDSDKRLLYDMSLCFNFVLRCMCNKINKAIETHK